MLRIGILKIFVCYLGGWLFQGGLRSARGTGVGAENLQRNEEMYCQKCKSGSEDIHHFHFNLKQFQVGIILKIF